MSFITDPLETSEMDLLDSARAPQLRSILMEGLSDPIMRKIAYSLSQRMRCPVQVLSCVNGVISHDSALSALPDLMLAAIVDLRPLHGRIIIAVEGDLIGAVVDAMFGATSSDDLMRRELSTMEQRIGKQMIDLTIAGLSEVLSGFMPSDWTIVQYEMAVGMLAIADNSFRSAVIDRVRVALTVRLGWTSLSVAALSELRTGQVIRLDQTLDEPLVITVGGKVLGFGQVVSLPVQRCGIKVIGLVRSSSEV